MAVYKRGKKWVADLYVGGRDGQRVRKGFPDQDMALAFELRMKLAEYAGDVPETRTESITLIEMITKYKELHDASNTPETQARNAWTFQHIEREFGDCLIHHQ